MLTLTNEDQLDSGARCNIKYELWNPIWDSFIATDGLVRGIQVTHAVLTVRKDTDPGPEEDSSEEHVVSVPYQGRSVPFIIIDDDIEWK